MGNLWKGFKEHRTFRFTSLLVILLIALVVLAPVIAPYNPLEAVMKDANQAPSMAHLFGTDKLGRDVLSRILPVQRAGPGGHYLLPGHLSGPCGRLLWRPH